MNYNFDFDVGATVALSRRAIEILVLCSRSHYDGVCSEAGLRIGQSPDSRSFVASRNGFIAVAEMQADGEFGEAPVGEVDVRMTTRQLDTCLKILEQGHLVAMTGKFDAREAWDLACGLRRVLVACCAKRRELEESCQRVTA